MVYTHLVTSPDPASPTGSPIPDAPLTQATLYYATLAAMTEDLHDSIYGEATANGHFAGVIGIGDAFQLALDQHLAKSAGFYDAKGVFSIAATGDPMNLWWDDYLHASKYGSYLDALVQFGTITGLDPRSLGLGEIAARDLAIAPADAAALQRIAAQQLNFAVPEPASLATFALGLAVIGFARKRRRVGAVGARERAGG
jgi:hypothetical protein